MICHSLLPHENKNINSLLLQSPHWDLGQRLKVSMLVMHPQPLIFFFSWGNTSILVRFQKQAQWDIKWHLCNPYYKLCLEVRLLSLTRWHVYRNDKCHLMDNMLLKINPLPFADHYQWWFNLSTSRRQVYCATLLTPINFFCSRLHSPSVCIDYQ